MNPLFSVIIPTYNRPQKVVRAIQSVLAQTYDNYEIWVIDDGSTENISEVLKPFKDRLNYLRKENGGLSSARNEGIRCSRGAYVAFLDDDDWWYKHKLEYIARAIQSRPDVGLFYSWVDFVNESGKILWVNKSRYFGNHTYLTLLQGSFIPTPTVVVKKSCFSEVGVFDETLKGCEDQDMWCRIARIFPVYLVKNVLGAYEYAIPSAMSGNLIYWINAHDPVMSKTLAADPNLSPGIQRRIRAGYAYSKGRIYFKAGDFNMAKSEFWKAFSLKPNSLKFMVYLILLYVPILRHSLSHRLKWLMRLPME